MDQNDHCSYYYKWRISSQSVNANYNNGHCESIIIEQDINQFSSIRFKKKTN